VLTDLLALARQHPGAHHGHAVAVLETMRPGGGVRRTLRVLEEQGLAREMGDGTWALTETGAREAEHHTPNGDES
ncbi:MAG: metal ABC transporter permease, partial [Gemmatimonadota bacterium]|nr:metal ABC transporter permease [Gemmatimonadota bacterium]